MGTTFSHFEQILSHLGKILALPAAERIGVVLSGSHLLFSGGVFPAPSGPPPGHAHTRHGVFSHALSREGPHLRPWTFEMGFFNLLPFLVCSFVVGRGNCLQGGAAGASRPWVQLVPRNLDAPIHWGTFSGYIFNWARQDTLQTRPLHRVPGPRQDFFFFFFPPWALRLLSLTILGPIKPWSIVIFPSGLGRPISRVLGRGTVSAPNCSFVTRAAG